MLTGLRLSDLIGLDLGSVDGREGERRLKVTGKEVTGKGSTVRFVPIEASPRGRHQPLPRDPEGELPPHKHAMSS
jgi:site-specific recombinase XerC